MECGIAAVEDKRGSLASHHKSVDTGSDDEGVYPGTDKVIVHVIVSVPSLKPLAMRIRMRGFALKVLILIHIDQTYTEN